MTTVAAGRTERQRRKLTSRIIGILFAVTSIGALLLARQFPKGSTEALLVSLIPMPFCLLSIVAVVWATRSCDELQRRIQFEALAIAFTGTFCLLELILLVQFAGFWRGVGAAEVMIGTSLLYMGGLLFARNRYQ